MKTSASRLTEPSAILRISADAALIQVACIFALVARYLIVYVFQNQPGTTDLRGIASQYVTVWYTKSFLLTIICLVSLGIAGVYTRRRFYMGRFKAFAVWQAVTVAFLAYGALGYFMRRGVPYEGGIYDFPIGAYLIAYAVSVGLLIGARTFIRVWHRFGDTQSRETRVDVQQEVADNTVLVIGGAGYIGSALVPQLLDAGYHVRVLDAMMFGEEPLQSVADHERLEIMRADFRSGLLGRAMRNVGTVVHLAGIVGDPACSLDEGLTIDVNLTSTRSIADMAKYSRVKRFVFASTCSVYGACDEMLDERSMAKPVSLYGNTKLASEKVLLEMADDSFSPTILRFATIYGLSGRTRFDLVVNLLSAKAKVDGKITVFNGAQWRPFVHVMDAALAIKTAVEAPVEIVHNEIFNVGSNAQNHTILEVGEMIHDQVIGAELLVDNSGEDARNYRVDFAKIRDLLGFAPKWTIEKGIEQVLDSIASGKVEDYRDPKYSNYAFLNLQGTTELARDHWAQEMIRNLEEGV